MAGLPVPEPASDHSAFTTSAARSAAASFGVAEFRRVLQSDPDFADAHYNLAVALDRLGGRSQARAHLERYITLEATGSGWTTRARALIDRLS